MGRLDQNPYYKEVNIDDVNWDNGLTAIVSDFSKKEDRILLVDADSIIHASIHPKKEEMREPYTEEEIDTIIIPKIKERLFSLKEEVSKGFNILEMYCFVGGKGSYRKQLFPLYKSNRPEKLPILDKVYSICKTDKDINFKPANDFQEADDMLYILGKEYGNLCVLSYIDKDLKQIPGVCYNYNQNIWYNITEEQARLSLAIQMCTGDDGDFIKVNKGLGEKTALKYVSLGMTNYQFIKNILRAYKDFNKDIKDVKPLIRQTYKLISLGKIYK